MNPSIYRFPPFFFEIARLAQVSCPFASLKSSNPLFTSNSTSQTHKSSPPQPSKKLHLIAFGPQTPEISRFVRERAVWFCRTFCSFAGAMSDISNPRPMVNSKLLKNYMGRRVTTVVKVGRVEGGNVMGELPDGVPVTVRQAPQHVAAQAQFVEVIGVVEGDRVLRAETLTSFGDNFDMATYNELCQLSGTENRDCFV